MSVPFLGEIFNFTQPDGTSLQVRGWGNQNRAVFETLDGFTVVKDPVTGFYQYASTANNGDELVSTGFQAERVEPRNLGLAPKIRASQKGMKESVLLNSGLPRRKTRWETRREITRMQERAEMMSVSEAPPKRQTVGDFVGLCILVDFPDEPGTISQAKVEAYCNRPGYKGFGNNGSVYDYFLDNSGGRLRYTSIITPYYTAQHNKAYYTDKTQPYTLRAQELIREAMNHFKAQNFNFNPLTVDSSNYVYATNIFYAGNVDNAWSEGLWPHSSRLSSDYQLMPGKIAADYQITDIGQELTLGTFCHENGHMICDFPDLYDYEDDKIASHGVGGFCLMCAGANIDQKNPTQVGAYLKFRAGWAASALSLNSGVKKIRAGANEFFLHRKNQREYFIIENRQKKGRDKALPGAGLAIWHIDELGSNENQNRTPTSHYECSLVQADANFDLERGIGSQYGEAKDLYFSGGNNNLSDSSSPNCRWWNGTPSKLNISGISAAGENMTFKVK